MCYNVAQRKLLWFLNFLNFLLLCNRVQQFVCSAEWHTWTPEHQSVNSTGAAAQSPMQRHRRQVCSFVMMCSAALFVKTFTLGSHAFSLYLLLYFEKTHCEGLICAQNEHNDILQRVLQFCNLLLSQGGALNLLPDQCVPCSRMLQVWTLACGPPAKPHPVKDTYCISLQWSFKPYIIAIEQLPRSHKATHRAFHYIGYFWCSTPAQN